MVDINNDVFPGYGEKQESAISVMIDEVVRKIKQYPTPAVPCGDPHIDLIADLILSARHDILSGNPAATMACLNVALDVVAKLQQEVRDAKAGQP